MNQVYHSPEWQNIVEATYGFSNLSEKIPGINTCYRVESFFSSGVICNSVFMFQAPLIDPSNELISAYLDLKSKEDEEVLLKSNNQLPSEVVNHFNLKESEISALSEISLDQFKDFSEYYEKLSKNFKKNLKRLINKRQREEIEIIVDDKLESLDEFYDVLALMYKNKDKIPAQPKRLFENIKKNLVPIKKVKLILAKKNDRILSGILVFETENATEYAWGGTLQKYNYLGLPMQLILESIKMSFERRDLIYSLGCSSPSDKGLRDFKNKFLGIERPVYGYSSKNEISGSSALAEGKTFINVVFSKLPLFVTKIISNFVFKYLGP